MKGVADDKNNMFHGREVSGKPQTLKDWRSIIDSYDLWKHDEADGYNVAADRLASLISFHLGQSAGACSFALRWFVDRRAVIQAKFNLHGPEDTAKAMVQAFDDAEVALAGVATTPNAAQIEHALATWFGDDWDAMGELWKSGSRDAMREVLMVVGIGPSDDDVQNARCEPVTPIPKPNLTS